MFWLRMIRILPALSFFLLSGPCVFGRNHNVLQEPGQDSPSLYGQGPGEGSHVAWEPADTSGRDSVPDAGHTQMEREMDQLNHSDPSGLLPGSGAKEDAYESSGNDTVSVQQLRHPLSRRWRALLAQLESDLVKGRVGHANKLMSKALQEPAAAPYVHGILGTHYLKQGWPAAAVPELEKAAQVLPNAPLHSNLGYALCLIGQTRRGEEELQKALSLDGASPQTRFLMGVLLLNQKSRDHEAQYDLRMAEPTIPTAHLALAISDLRRGEQQAAENQLGEFLGPNRKDELLQLWSWASEMASKSQPATAFGFPYQIAGSPQEATTSRR